MNPGPKSINSRRIASEARRNVHSAFNVEYWEYHEITGNDVGIDCFFEYIENETFTGKIISCQVKGTENIKISAAEDFISFPLDVKNIKYWLNYSNPVILLLNDIIDSKIYFLCIQEYFRQNKDKFENFTKNTTTVNVRIPIQNVLSDGIELVEYVYNTYKFENYEVKLV